MTPGSVPYDIYWVINGRKACPINMHVINVEKDESSRNQSTYSSFERAMIENQNKKGIIETRPMMER